MKQTGMRIGVAFRWLFAQFAQFDIELVTPLACLRFASGITDPGSRLKMWPRTRLFFLAWTLALLIGSRVTRSQRPRLGGAVNVFSRYGYLSISMRVVPRNDTETWIFREPTLDVFKNPAAMPPKQRQQGKTSTAVFEGDFHMEFCDNIRHVRRSSERKQPEVRLVPFRKCSVLFYRQLLQAYFRDFTFEKLERPWRAFTGSWSKAAIARHLGINSSFITGDHCYVLVRVARFHDNQRLVGTAENLVLDDSVLRQTENVTIGDTASVVRFIRNFGSHYIASYITGNSLYQVSNVGTSDSRG
jgi:torso-like protein